VFLTNRRRLRSERAESKLAITRGNGGMSEKRRLGRRSLLEKLRGIKRVSGRELPPAGYTRIRKGEGREEQLTKDTIDGRSPKLFLFRKEAAIWRHGAKDFH